MTHPVTLKGASSAGIGTCITVTAPFRVVLDLGFVTPEAQSTQTVVLTHAHMDHMVGAAAHAATRSLVGAKPTRFICSKVVAEALEKVLKVWVGVQGPFEWTIEIVEPGGEISLQPSWVVKPVHTFHTMPSQGYVFFHVKKVLKPEFVGKSYEELRALALAGAVMKNRVETPVLAYLGDTTPEALGHRYVKACEMVVTECTFIGEHSVEKARAKGHTHVKELLPCLAALKAKRVVLMHFSQRHSLEEIHAAFTGTQPVELLLNVAGPIPEW